MRLLVLGAGFSGRAIAQAFQAAGYAAAQGIVLFLIIAVFTVLLNLWFDHVINRKMKNGE